jgi:hypothetical protein
MKKENYKITKYNSVKSPKVMGATGIGEIFHTIKAGDENLPNIQKARAVGKGSPEYEQIKTVLLPTYRFNFIFKTSASNSNITAATGLIYLDVDNADAIPESEYVFAKWKSLSDTGFGVLVKTDNLTVDNYSEVYNELSQLIGVTTDTGARKATQQTVLSYDPNLYHNDASVVYHYTAKNKAHIVEVDEDGKQTIHVNTCNKTSSSSTINTEGSIDYDYTEKKKVSYAIILNKKEECITRDDTFSDSYSSVGIRFNNINDYFTDNTTPYVVFEEKKSICNPYLPFNISKGARNSVMFYHLTQQAVLNPHTGRSFLKSIADSICLRMTPKLSEREINSTIDSVLKMRKEGQLEMYLNQERRVLFNPVIKILFNDKMKIVNGELGKRKKDKARLEIYLVLEGWNFKAAGKITQNKVVIKAEKSIGTIKRYWPEFKEYVRDLNASRPL